MSRMSLDSQHVTGACNRACHFHVSALHALSLPTLLSMFILCYTVFYSMQALFCLFIRGTPREGGGGGWRRNFGKGEQRSLQPPQ